MVKKKQFLLFPVEVKTDIVASKGKFYIFIDHSVFIGI